MKPQSTLLAILVATVGQLLVSGMPMVRADEGGVQSLEWNVLLQDWLLLGPFPKADADPDGLATTFVTDEAQLRAGRVTFYEGKLYTWAKHAGRMINFRTGLNAHNAAGNYKVAYAWTQFNSPVAQKARIAVGYDDQLIAWLNGEEVSRGTDNMWASLDQQISEVNLRAGTNTLILKVANGTQGWEGLVRLLPAEPVAPLFEFQVTGASDAFRLPVIEIELLDADREVISQHRCSGSRGPDSFNSSLYRLYADSPQTEPSLVRLSVREPGFSVDETLVSWKRLQAGNFKLSLAADRAVELSIVDAKTRKPLQGVTIWRGKERESSTTNAEGRIALPRFSPLTDRCYAVARGYVATTVNLNWPRRGPQRVELQPGGHSVTGTIVSTTGEPIDGATVTSGISGGYSPIAITDKDGRFELASIPDSRTRIYPVIEAAGFVAKGRFSVDLTQDQTDVRWELAPGATIAGRIVNKASGAPVAGVTLTTGQDRFGSNNPHATARSKDDGTYELIGVTPGETLIHAFSENFAPAMQRVTAAVGTPVQLDFEIAEGKPVSGVIRDKDGKPVPDVRLITDTWNGARMFEREARTDKDGNFVLSHMPHTQAEVHVLKRGFISQRDLMVSGGDTVDLTMLPIIVHTISIRDAAKEQIVPDLQISKGYLWDGNRDWYWQSREYDIRDYNKLKGEMRIEISEKPSTYEIAYRFRANGFGEEIIKLPRDLTEGKTIDVRLRPAKVFEGRVVDATSGLPLRDVIVAAVSREDRLRADRYSDFQTPWQYMQSNRSSAVTSVTDEDGRFRLPTQSRKAEGAGLALLAKEGSFHFVTGDIFADVDEETDKVLELPMPASASLSGRLTVGGKPVARTNIRIQWQGLGRDNQDTWNGAFGVGGQITTDSDGRYSFPRLGPGSYQINRVFRIPLGESQTITAYLGSETVTLLPGADAVHDFARPAGVKLSGTVKRDDEMPATGCVVYAAETETSNVRIDAAIADSNGRFTFEHLAPGDYQLSAELHVRHPQGYYDTGFVGTTSVTHTEATEDIEITLAKVNRNPTLQQVTQLHGTLAPDFSVTPLNSDTPIVLSKRFGKATVVCFWSADDSTVTALNAFHRQFKTNSEVAIVPVFTQGKVLLEHHRQRLAEQPQFPIVVGESMYSAPLLDLFSGGRQDGCFVIDRDGRFAAERIDVQSLAKVVEGVLDKSADHLTDDNVATLDVLLSSDESDQGIPGAKLRLQAVDASGKTIREDRYEINGTPRKLRWAYPSLSDGGQIEVELSGQGIEPQKKTLASPSRTESIGFDNASPRRITGTVINAATGKPEANVEVLVVRNDFGLTRPARSDEAGKIDVPCYPGSYFVTSALGGDFVLSDSAIQSVNVTQASDPPVIQIKVARTTTIKGRVLDTAGQPASGALVMVGNSHVRTDKDGAFQLSGIPSIGQAQLWASTIQEEYGAIIVNDPSAADDITVQIGQGLSSDATKASSMTIGQPVPSLKVLSLDGAESVWSAKSDSERLVVIGPLWHRSTKALLVKAKTWCEKNEKKLQVLSLDWSIEQARRESELLGIAAETLFAGPGTLTLSEQWLLPSHPTTVLLSSDGRIVGTPVE